MALIVLLYHVYDLCVFVASAQAELTENKDHLYITNKFLASSRHVNADGRMNEITSNLNVGPTMGQLFPVEAKMLPLLSKLDTPSTEGAHLAGVRQKVGGGKHHDLRNSSLD